MAQYNRSILLLLLTHCLLLQTLTKKRRTQTQPVQAALPTGFYTVPVYGSDNLKYYYADIFVGTPAQKQSVIVDTGSDYLAFPCSLCNAGQCGKHNNPVFNIKSDSTIKVMPCGSKFENFTCSKTCMGQQCGFKRSYLEGSGLSGVVFQDYIGVIAPQETQTGNTAIKKPLVNQPKVQTFPRALGLFGCTTQETG